MQTLTRLHVKNVINHIPESKLLIAYNFLIELTDKKVDNISENDDHENYVLKKQFALMENQAHQLFSHYQQTKHERQMWQAGDFSDEY